MAQSTAQRAAIQMMFGKAKDALAQGVTLDAFDYSVAALTADETNRLLDQFLRRVFEEALVKYISEDRPGSPQFLATEDINEVIQMVADNKDKSVLHILDGEEFRFVRGIIAGVITPPRASLEDKIKELQEEPIFRPLRINPRFTTAYRLGSEQYTRRLLGIINPTNPQFLRRSNEESQRHLTSDHPPKTRPTKHRH